MIQVNLQRLAMPYHHVRLLMFSVLLLSTLYGRGLLAQNVPSNEVFDLQDHAGKVVYVDFWASWCVPCLASFPFMADVQEELGEQLVVIAINVDENKRDALEFLASFHVPFEIVYDPQGELAEGFAIPGMPTSFLFDRGGKLLLRHVGFRKSASDDLRQAIADAVQDPHKVIHSAIQ